MARRTYRLQRIRLHYAYDIDEIHHLLSVNPQTIRGWIKDGLPTIDNGKPSLVFGLELKGFLQKLNSRHKRTTALDEMFCMSCKESKPTYKKKVVLEQKHNAVRAPSHAKPVLN